jgi:hypothetical protein
MSFLSRLFGARKTTSSPAVAATLVTNAKSPFRIVAPSIGFLNLRGVAGNEELEKDKNVLEGLFGKTVVAIDVIPRCDVLFVYCNFDVAGTIVGHKKSLREIIRDARAYIVVVASENDPKTYMKCTGDRKVWPREQSLKPARLRHPADRDRVRRRAVIAIGLVGFGVDRVERTLHDLLQFLVHRFKSTRRNFAGPAPIRNS